jgi:N-dimethylarginine dimethylaminohydrolase
MIAPLRRVLVKRPEPAFAVDDPARWHYLARPRLEIARQEHDALVAHLRQAGAEVLYHDELQPDHADAIFVFDPALITDRGAIIADHGSWRHYSEPGQGTALGGRGGYGAPA